MFSCDTMVALSNSTRGGNTLFAKNSDRPPEEFQPLRQEQRFSRHKEGNTGCQYVEVPQTVSTYAHIGSQPSWCWGYEHGFNENQVVIGNEGLPSKLNVSSKPKLIGMEIVRLVLERSHTASHGVDLITTLVTKYGQGKFENGNKFRTYDNGFIVADPREAYIIETAGHDWVVKQVESVAGISNVYSIGKFPDQISPTAEMHAKKNGFWETNSRDFDFSVAYRDLESSTIGRSSERLNRSYSVLKNNIRNIDLETMMNLLKDHSDGNDPLEEFCAEMTTTRSICTHYGDYVKSNTTASLIADLSIDASRVPVYWTSMYSPCIGIFLPIFLEGNIPSEMTASQGNDVSETAWWVFRALEKHVRRGNELDEVAVASVKEQWRDFQTELLRTAYSQAQRASVLIDEGEEGQLSSMLTKYMRQNFDQTMTIAKNILSHS